MEEGGFAMVVVVALEHTDLAIGISSVFDEDSDKRMSNFFGF